MKPYIIGITGGSGSGKTLFINKIMENFSNEEVSFVSQDNYYNPRDKQPLDEMGEQNFDKPESIDIAQFTHDLIKLIHGEIIRTKEYTFNNPELDPKIIEFQPAPVIILEGIFIFYVEEISELIDLKIFIDAPEHIMLKRRIIRDQKERGYDLDDVLYRYEHHVMPAFNQYILPYKDFSDIIVNNHKNFDEGVRVIRSHISSVLKK
jgi:uridine kinase